ncbi:MAG: GNAT family N-acetyltransferase [Promethearchaeota archaeon]
MKLKSEIIRLQEFLMNSWPAKHYFFLNGWILRFTDGVTFRANSVFPIRYTGTQETLNYDIKLVEYAYNRHKLEPVFTMPEFYEPSNLKEILLQQGYYSFDHTIALSINVEEIQRVDIMNDFTYCILDSRTEEIAEFLAAFSKRDENEQKIIQKINQRIIIPKKCYMIAKDREKVIATLLAVLVPQGYLYIGDVFVHPDYRRQGIATSMLVNLISRWGIDNSVKYIWLQVERKNNKALNLYYKLGMKQIYNYFYMKRDR